MRRLENPTTVFEKIPDYFVERYDDELQAWGANFAKIGPIKHIVLREGVFSDMSPNPENGPMLLQVALIAEVGRDRKRVVVRPLDEQSETLIARHCEKMQRLGITARARLVEPERTGIPLLPDRYN